MVKNKRYLLVAVAMVLSVFSHEVASAGQLSQTGIRLGRLGISATANNDVLVTFTLNTTPTSVAKIKATFPAGFTLTTGTPAVSTTGFPLTPASITAPPGTLTAAVTGSGANAGGTIIVSGLTSASLNGSTLYGFIIPTGSVQNPASAAQYSITLESDNASSVAIDTDTEPVYITGGVANADQVTVNASVAPNFSFSLSANSDTIPRVDTSTIQTSPGVTMTVGTNSPLGYTAYVKSATGSLTSTVSPGTPIPTGTFDNAVDTIAAGTSKYGLVPATGTACTSCTGTITYNGEYAVASGTQAGSFNGTSFAAFVSRNGYTNADAITLKERIAVGASIGAANDYADTLTYVAAGNY
jgi:hypothetical protein